MPGRGRTDGNATRRPFLRLRLLCVLPLALGALAGCRSNNKTALIEAELRTRNREVREMRTDLDRAEMFNGALQSELRNRQLDCSAPPFPPSSGIIDGPQAVMSSMVRQVVLGRGTGGVDDDGWPGDEALQVVIVPQDVDGSAVKVPGTAVVQAFEITAEGLKVPLARWEVSALQLQRSWRSGLFSTGYFVTLPWKTWPASEKLRVVVQFFTLPNNRPFEVDRDVTVKVLPGGPRRPAGAPPGVEMVPPCVPDALIVPAMPASAEPLPPPANGPLLPPGMWMRRRDMNHHIEAAKPAAPRSDQPVRLLDPQASPDDSHKP